MNNEEMMRKLVSGGNNSTAGNGRDTTGIARAIVSISSFALFALSMLFVPIAGPMMWLPACGFLAHAALPSEELNKLVNSKNFLIKAFSRIALASTVIGAVLHLSGLFGNRNLNMEEPVKFIASSLKERKGKGEENRVNSSNKPKELTETDSKLTPKEPELPRQVAAIGQYATESPTSLQNVVGENTHQRRNPSKSGKSQVQRITEGDDQAGKHKGSCPQMK